MYIILPFLLVYLFALFPISKKFYLQITFFYFFIIFSIVDLSYTGDGLGYSIYFDTVNNFEEALLKGRLVDDLTTSKYYFEISFTFLISIFKTISEDSEQLIMIASAALQSLFLYKTCRIINLDKLLSASLITNYLGFSGIYFYLHYIRQGIAVSLIIYGITLLYLTDKRKIFGILAILIAGTFHITSFLASVPLLFLIDRFFKPKFAYYIFPLYLIYIALGDVSFKNLYIYFASFFNVGLSNFLMGYSELVGRYVSRYSYTIILAFIIWLIITYYINKSEFKISKFQKLISLNNVKTSIDNSNRLLYFCYIGLSTLVVSASYSTFIPFLTRSFFTFYFFIGLGIIIIFSRAKLKFFYPFLGIPGITIFARLILTDPFLKLIYFSTPQPFF